MGNFDDRQPGSSAILDTVVVPLFTQPVNAATVGPTCLSDLDKNLLKAILRNPENYYVTSTTRPSLMARCAAS
jgi:hypothetical protein